MIPAATAVIPFEIPSKVLVLSVPKEISGSEWNVKKEVVPLMMSFKELIKKLEKGTELTTTNVLTELLKDSGVKRGISATRKKIHRLFNHRNSVQHLVDPDGQLIFPNFHAKNIADRIHQPKKRSFPGK